jgi:hypothetical protein
MKRLPLINGSGGRSQPMDQAVCSKRFETLPANNLSITSSRLDKSWSVLASHQTYEADRCVDIFSRPNRSFGFEEFRRDPEDMGAWTPVSYFSGHEYPTESDAIDAAKRAVSWLGALLDR